VSTEFRTTSFKRDSQTCRTSPRQGGGDVSTRTASDLRTDLALVITGLHNTTNTRILIILPIIVILIIMFGEKIRFHNILNAFYLHVVFDCTISLVK
jgi:hypothetical protein